MCKGGEDYLERVKELEEENAKLTGESLCKGRKIISLQEEIEALRKAKCTHTDACTEGFDEKEAEYKDLIRAYKEDINYYRESSNLFNKQVIEKDLEIEELKKNNLNWIRSYEELLDKHIKLLDVYKSGTSEY